MLLNNLYRWHVVPLTELAIHGTGRAGVFKCLNQSHCLLYTHPRKLESKKFCAQTSVIHHQKRIASGFPGMCDFKSVHGAPGEIFHFEGFQILKLGLFF